MLNRMGWGLGLLLLAAWGWGAVSAPTGAIAGRLELSQANCHPAYPDVCIPPPPPDLDCGEIEHRQFRVLPPDPHRFDGDRDGIGCEAP